MTEHYRADGSLKRGFEKLKKGDGGIIF